MKEIHMFARNIDDKALRQFESAINQPFAVKGALMPDAHYGYSLPIGAVIATEDVIVPAWVGFDIGCGMVALKTSFALDDVIQERERIFDEIYRVIPTGFHHNAGNSSWNYSTIDMSKALLSLFDKNGLRQICSLGGGNHFIEISKDEQDNIWVVIHSGSRGIGHDIAAYYMRLASGGRKASEGHYALPVNSKEGKNYIKDLNFCLEFALENRRQMVFRVVNVLKRLLYGRELENLDFTGLINRNHNHAEYKDGCWIHRKGATHAEKGMMGVIPGNMRDGSFIVEGLGNPDSLCSSSHGAGRALGRREAKKKLAMEDFKESMEGITAKVKNSTLDESPLAYKNIFEIMEIQKGLVDIKHHLKPLINIKA